MSQGFTNQGNLSGSGTANQVAYWNSSTGLTGSANLTFDGTDLGIGSGIRFRMLSQNRIRYLNSMVSVAISADLTGRSINVWNTIAFNTETFDTDTLHDTVTNNSRLTAAIAGKYLVTGAMINDTSGVTTPSANGIRITKNGGTTVVYGSAISSSGSVTQAALNCTAIILLAATDYVELQDIVTGSAGTYKILSSGGITAFEMAYIGE